MNTDRILDALADVRADIKGVNDRLDTLNSRTRKVEQKVFAQWILWTALGAGVASLLPALVERFLR